MTRHDFARCIAVLSSGVGREMSQPTIEVWYRVLGDLTVEQLEAGIVRGLRTYKFAGFPPIAAVREWAGCGDSELRIEDRAALAWDRVLTAIARVGGYHSVEFDDVAIHATIRTLGGWATLCDTPSQELRSFVRPRFLESYRAHVAAGVHADAAAALPGLIAADRSREGYDAPEPVRIATHLPPTVKRINAPAIDRPRLDPSSPIRRLAATLPQVDPVLAEETPLESDPPASPLTAEQFETHKEAQIQALKSLAKTRPAGKGV